MADRISKDGRARILSELKSEENLARKREAQKRFDVYRGRIDTYIEEKLEHEFTKASFEKMRKSLSINISERIVDEMSSVYLTPPERHFIDASDSEIEQIQALYAAANINTKLKAANKFYNIYDNQAILYIIPRNGIIDARPLAEMDFDIIPYPEDPEKAEVLIINTWDSYNNTMQTGDSYSDKYRQQDGVNQSIADNDDRKAKEKRMIVWTAEHHYSMNGEGELLTEITPNPIGRLPIVDISTLKDGQFFVRRGSSIVDFAIELGVDISDLSNTVKFQGYSQAVCISEKAPVEFIMGPMQVLHMPINPKNPEITPRFEFVSPGNNTDSAINAIELKIRLFLTSKGLDPKVVSSSGTTYSSGIERLIAMFDKFQATQDDFDLFAHAEREVLEIFKLWNNELVGRKGELQLNPKLQGGVLSDSMDVVVKFAGPQAVVTDSEELANIQNDLEIGLISRSEAIARRRGVEIEEAKKIMAEIDAERTGLMSAPEPPKDEDTEDDAEE